MASSNSRPVPKTTNPNQTNFDAMDRLSSSTLKRNPKMELSKSDLLKLLTYLEGELQAREIVIATLKAERVKQLLYQAKYGQFSLNDPFAALQRDSYGAYSTNCDEASIKSMYNNQLSQVENLILQHRRAQIRLRQHVVDAGVQHAKIVGDLEEEIRKHAQDTAQGDDVTYMLEKERERLHQEVELERQQNKKLERELKKVVQALEQDKARHKQIVVLLLEDRKRIIGKLLDEHSKNEEMTQFLTMEKGRMADVVDGLEEESKKSLLMEAELEQQAAEFAIEREQLKRMLERKESENRQLLEKLANLEREAASHLRSTSDEDEDDLKLYGELSSKQLTVGGRPSKSPSPVPPPGSIPPQQHSSTLIIGSSPGASPVGSISPLPMQSSTIVRTVRAITPTPPSPSGAPAPPNGSQHMEKSSIVRNVVSAITGATLPAPPSTAPPPPPSVAAPRVSVSASPGTRVYTTTQGGKVTFHVTAPPQPPKKPPLLAATVVAAAPAGVGRGTPPPVPPNKPVLPKKEAGFAQHVLSGGSAGGTVMTICSSASPTAATPTVSGTGPVKINASPMPGGGVKFGITIGKPGDSHSGGGSSSSSSASHLVLSSAPNSAGGGATVVSASSCPVTPASGKTEHQPPQVQQIFKETQCGASQPVIITAISSPGYGDDGDSFGRSRYLASDVARSSSEDESLTARTADELAPEIADFQQLLLSMAATSQPSSVFSDNPIAMTHQSSISPSSRPLGGSSSKSGSDNGVGTSPSRHLPVDADNNPPKDDAPSADVGHRSGSPMGRLSAMLEQWKIERGMSTVTTMSTTTVSASSFSTTSVRSTDERTSSVDMVRENGSPTGFSTASKRQKLTKNCGDQQQKTVDAGGRRSTAANFNPCVRKVVSPTLPKSFNNMKL